MAYCFKTETKHKKSHFNLLHENVKIKIYVQRHEENENNLFLVFSFQSRVGQKHINSSFL